MLMFNVTRTDDGGLMLHMIDQEEQEEVQFHFDSLERYEGFLKYLSVLGKQVYYDLPIGHS